MLFKPPGMRHRGWPAEAMETTMMLEPELARL